MKILFLCTGNACRSPLAEALLKKINPDLTVESAGLHIAIPISRHVKDYLKTKNALGFLKEFPETIGEKNLGTYDIIVAMEQRHEYAALRQSPECKNKIRVWNIRDPYFEEIEDAKRIYAEIEVKVKELAKSI
jgi:protein-tyrosine-phosphatase